MKLEEIYDSAAKATGKTKAQLVEMSMRVFASMLLKIMEDPEAVIWTAATLRNGFSVEVDAKKRT